MQETPYTQPLPLEISENRFPLVDFKREFCPLLVKRLYPMIRWIGDAQGTILLFINIVDRTSFGSIKRRHLLYAGADALPELMGEAEFLKDKGALHKAIDKLLEYEIEFEKTIEGGRLYREFRDGDLALDDINIGQLKHYYEKYKNKGEFENEAQGLEYPLIDHFFAIEKDYFLSLPLIQFGNFDGLVHIVFEQKDKDSFTSTHTHKLLIRQFSNEYEGILLDWDLVGDNMQRKSTLPRQLTYLTSDEYEVSSQTNPIFVECQYRNYYLNSMAYYKKRIEHSDEVPAYIKNEHRKRAIISILIDSYAHNISAHSLTVLKWWFQQRASNSEEISIMTKEVREDKSFKSWGYELRDYLDGRFPSTYTKDDIELGIASDLARWIHLVQKNILSDQYLPVRDQFLPLAEQLYPLFKFLLEKGAFWSGVTRDQQFGGEIRNLYDVLWYDFINNPLYLGTIAYSEGITKLNINIRFYSGEKYVGDEHAFKRQYKIEQDVTSGKLLSGEIAVINVGNIQKGKIEHKYVQEGDMYALLSERLKECDVFFPGGVVGKHSFFTLIENEIRNVKHYSEEDLKGMREEGLNIFIGIRPGNLLGGPEAAAASTNKQLYKIGVWLGHKVSLYDSDEHLIIKRLRGIQLDIVTPSHQARLGGNFQDKICAAMLFNNTFLSVEQQNTKRDKAYYPWIRSAYSEGVELDGIIENDFEVRAKNLDQAETALMAEQDRIDRGYFKKYFHIWKGAHLFHLQQHSMLEFENIARFKMVAIKDPKWKKEVRENGIIRVLENIPTDASLEEAYHAWLNKWLKEGECRVAFIQGVTTVGHLVFDSETIHYFSQSEYTEGLTEDQQEIYSDYPVFELKFAHGDKMLNGQHLLSVRSHGQLVNHFFENLESINDFDEARISKERMYELLEVVQTKICIFDKRVAERVEKNDKRKYLREQLKCGIYWENADDWEALKTEGLHNYHFIIMHLSFIEALTDASGKRYGEEGIVRFLREQVEGNLSDNCVFVVTTGRGREEWWRKLQESEYMTFATFRPVEMLIEAVEQGRMRNDDIDLKYNLVKVLFGS